MKFSYSSSLPTGIIGVTSGREGGEGGGRERDSASKDANEAQIVKERTVKRNRREWGGVERKERRGGGK